jgi:hypothetical protein
MVWTTLSLMGILLMGGVGALLWQRQRARWLVLTRQTVRCPLYDCQATTVVRTNPLVQPGRQHVDVASCSLHPETLVTLPEKMVYVTDSSYDRLYPQALGRYPRSTLGVPCRKNCLAILNMAVDSCAMQPVRCTSEAHSGPDLAQQATHNPVMTQALWFSSAACL